MFYRNECSKTQKVVDLPSVQTSIPSPNRTVPFRPTRNLNVEDSENHYVDCVFVNNVVNNLANVKFTATRTQNILSDKANYKVAVVSLSGHIIIPLLTSGNINLHTEFIRADNTTGNATAIVPIGTIYSVDTFVDLFNVACNNLWINTAAAYGANWGVDYNPPLLAPGIAFNPSTNKFTLFADTRMESFLPANMKLYLDVFTANLLIGVNLLYPPGLFGNIQYNEVVFSAGFSNLNVITLNGNNYIENIQDFPSVGLWNKNNSIIIGSSSLGIRSTQYVKTTVTNNSSSNLSFNILDSFPISFSGELNRIASFSHNTLHYSDITSHGPLNYIEYEVYTQDDNGNISPLQCAPGGIVNLRLVFSKTLFTS